MSFLCPKIELLGSDLVWWAARQLSSLCQIFPFITMINFSHFPQLFSRQNPLACIPFLPAPGISFFCSLFIPGHHKDEWNSWKWVFRPRHYDGALKWAMAWIFNLNFACTTKTFDNKLNGKVRKVSAEIQLFSHSNIFSGIVLRFCGALRVSRTFRITRTHVRSRATKAAPPISCVLGKQFIGTKLSARIRFLRVFLRFGFVCR